MTAATIVAPGAAVKAWMTASGVRLVELPAGYDASDLSDGFVGYLCQAYSRPQSSASAGQRDAFASEDIKVQRAALAKFLIDQSRKGCDEAKAAASSAERRLASEIAEVVKTLDPELYASYKTIVDAKTPQTVSSDRRYARGAKGLVYRLLSSTNVEYQRQGLAMAWTMQHMQAVKDQPPTAAQREAARLQSLRNYAAEALAESAALTARVHAPKRIPPVVTQVSSPWDITRLEEWRRNLRATADRKLNLWGRLIAGLPEDWMEQVLTTRVDRSSDRQRVWRALQNAQDILDKLTGVRAS